MNPPQRGLGRLKPISSSSITGAMIFLGLKIFFSLLGLVALLHGTTGRDDT